jgi:hypothetical protein
MMPAHPIGQRDEEEQAMFAGQTIRPSIGSYVSGHVASVAAIVFGVAVTAAIVLALMLSSRPSPIAAPAHAAAPAPITIPAVRDAQLPNGLTPVSVPDTKIAHPLVAQ